MNLNKFYWLKGGIVGIALGIILTIISSTKFYVDLFYSNFLYWSDNCMINNMTNEIICSPDIFFIVYGLIIGLLAGVLFELQKRNPHSSNLLRRYFS